MKSWTRYPLLLGLALVAMPALAGAQGMEGHEMEGQEMAHEERHEMMVEKVTAEIEAASAAFAEAFSAGDAAAVAAMYTEDAVVLAPGTGPVEGRAAIEEMMAADFAGMEGMVMSFETSEVDAMHGHAIEVGGYTLEGADGSHIDHGKFIAVWNQTDDGWKIARDIWNSSMGD